MPRNIIEFYSEDGILLNGYINKCNNNTDKVLIEIHGMTSNCFKNRENTIASKVENINIDTISFNNRGSDIVRYLKKKSGEKILGGTAYENIEDSYNDIVGVIKFAVKNGYKSIYLQGHSLGATKIVYTYNEMKKENNSLLQYVKGILLLSLVDIPDIFKSYSNKDMFEYAQERERENKVNELMPPESFIHPLSVKTYLKYTKYNNKINFAQYGAENNNFEELNNIDIPLFMRWGNQGELITENANNIVKMMNSKIKNYNKDINYIEGANHTYNEKEDILAEQISGFLNNI